MNIFRIVLIFSIFTIIPQLTFSQNKKPKVVLVLSGGGAKGLAHIATLQTLDSLGIVPDLVIGTSMGSVVGGLYSMGYSGDSIASIASTINWKKVLGGSLSLRYVSNEEKNQFKQYLVDFDLVKRKPKVYSSVLNDSNLRNLLATLTFPVLEINNFDDLSIPFRAMTTDIVNGKEVLLSKGSLSLAMRASMSIPAIFKPVPYNKTLLVDGGVLNNFPVDVAVELGADFIIGSDVGGGMASKEDLDNMATLLFQSGMLMSNIKNPENQKLCDILINHYPNLTYSTSDFEKGKLIYEEGKIATKENLDKLVDLAEILKEFEQKNHELPDVKNLAIFDTITYTGIREGNIELIKARINIKANEPYTPAELVQGINRAMGTTLFRQITYNTFVFEDKIGLQFNGLQHSRHQLKGSLHYDTYRGVGLIANYTGRNIMGKSSRFFVSLDIAQQPKFRIQYQKNIGEQKKWWWRSDVLFEHLKQKVFIAGKVADEMNYNHLLFDNQFNKNINPFNSFIGVGINYELTKITPILDPNIINLSSYLFNNFEFYAHYVYNNMNREFYPTKGNTFKGSIGRSFLSKVDLNYNLEELTDFKGKTNSYTKLNLEFEKRVPFNNRITGIIGANTNIIFEDNLKTGQISFSEFGYAQKYFLGGNLPNQRKNSYMFPGLHEDELNVSQITKLNLAVQFNPAGNLYVIPHVDIASLGFGSFKNYYENLFSFSGNWTEGDTNSLLFSAGTSFSYNSFLGPVNFDVSWVNRINKVRLFFSIGLMLN